MNIVDTMTVIRARGRRLAKLIRPDGSVDGYDDAKHFDLFEVHVSDLGAITRLLGRLLDRPDCAVVRGAIADPRRIKRVRRLLYPDAQTGDASTIRVVPRMWLAVDVEGVERPLSTAASDLKACAAVAIERLPVLFGSAMCVVQASASHGVKPDIRLRLWYWLTRPTTGKELKRWFRGSPADPSVFGAAQIIYTAAPVIARGAVDPLPKRIAVIPGVAAVQVPTPEELAPPPRTTDPGLLRISNHSTDHYARAALVRAADRIMHAKSRHPVIISESRGLARLVHGGILAENDMRAVIQRAAHAAGKCDDEEIAACIAWALAHPSGGHVSEVSGGR